MWAQKLYNFWEVTIFPKRRNALHLKNCMMKWYNVLLSPRSIKSVRGLSIIKQFCANKEKIIRICLMMKANRSKKVKN